MTTAAASGPLRPSAPTANLPSETPSRMLVAVAGDLVDVLADRFDDVVDRFEFRDDSF